MDYQGDIIRPPSEALSIILQVTTGCSHNRCTFCGAYRSKRFTIKPAARILADLDFAATWCKRQQTLFLADGDALALPDDRLLWLLTQIRRQLPWVRRVATLCYLSEYPGKNREPAQRLPGSGLEENIFGAGKRA